MGCDIHSFAEVRNGNEFFRVKEKIFDEDAEPFGNRNYSVFGFIGNIYNRYNSEFLSDHRGFPEDSNYLNSVSEYADDYNRLSGEEIPVSERTKVRDDISMSGYFGKSYVLLSELLAFDYNKTFSPWDDGPISYREFLGQAFFRDLEILKTLGNPDDVRVVFWFDN